MTCKVIVGHFDKATAVPRNISDEEITIPEEPEFTGDYQIELNRLLHRLENYLDAFTHVPGSAGYDLLCSDVMGAFWNARRAMNRKQFINVPGFLKEMHIGLLKVAQATDEYDGTWPLINTSMQLLSEWFSPADLSPRMDVAAQASSFVSRLAQHFKTATHPPTAADWDAIDLAGGVVLSALSDKCVSDESLETELDHALEMSSVFLFEQPPKSTGIAPCSHDSLVGLRKSALDMKSMR
jgi:hypothetical protein